MGVGNPTFDEVGLQEGFLSDVAESGEIEVTVGIFRRSILVP